MRCQVGDDGDIDAATVHKYFMESFGADVKMKDVFDEDSQYDIGKTWLNLALKIFVISSREQLVVSLMAIGEN